MAQSRPVLSGLLVVPGAITLAVTLARLAGELAGGSQALFNRDAGGPFAVVGIVWLIPIFGGWFALRLARGGEAPARLGAAAGWAVLAFAANTAVFVAAFLLFPRSPVAQLALFGVGSWIAILIARRGWPALWRILLAYGFVARVPVLVVMFLAIFLDWNSHYAKPRPDFPPMGHWGRFWWTAFLPQMAIWIYVTIVLGMLAGAAVLALRRLAGGRETSLTSAA